MFTGCSAVQARWYLRPAPAIAAKSEAAPVPVARWLHEGIVLEAWAVSPQYRTMQGPPLVPLWSVEPPVLNTSEISLLVNVQAAANATGALEVDTASLAVVGNTGTLYRPHAVSVTVAVAPDTPAAQFYYNASDEKYPERIALSGNGQLRMDFYGLYFATEKKLLARFKLRTGERTWSTYEVEFIPERDYTYTAWELPFAYAPVR